MDEITINRDEYIKRVEHTYHERKALERHRFSPLDFIAGASIPFINDNRLEHPAGIWMLNAAVDRDPFTAEAIGNGWVAEFAEEFLDFKGDVTRERLTEVARRLMWKSRFVFEKNYAVNLITTIYGLAIIVIDLADGQFDTAEIRRDNATGEVWNWVGFPTRQEFDEAIDHDQ